MTSPTATSRWRELRLEVRRRWLERQERLALRRLGRRVSTRDPGGSEELRCLSAEIRQALEGIEALSGESRASRDADRADLARVAGWVRPIVVVRGTCDRLVLWHRRQAACRALDPAYERLGRLAAHPDFGGASGELAILRADLDEVAAEQARRVVESGMRALPTWSGRAAGEAAGFGRAVVMQLRSHFIPKAPALAGLVVGWWIANTYTDSHLRSTLRSIGLGSGGTRVVSSSTYDAMQLWLPLLAAALCAYLGERIGAWYRAERWEG